ncbi:MAG TPA: penicillin-binding protein 2 [Candidatus Dormibacteraeota bacterium]|nr:penicillin-binding protein 2 [Candidatus Dormibacteraeota bacterium]
MRAKLFFALLVAVGAYLCWRLVDVQVVNGKVYARDALEQQRETLDVPGRRGQILDRDGAVLVTSHPSESVFAVPAQITDPAATATRVAAVLHLHAADVEPLLTGKGEFVWIARKIPTAQAERLRHENITGINVIHEETGQRVDVDGTLASPVLGFVGIDENGLSGLEYEFDRLLRGRPGKMTMETDHFGDPIPFAPEIVDPARPGVTLELTIDRYLQFVTEQALGAQIRKWHARGGTAIVVDPNTGGILAMASLPDFNPNEYWKSKPAVWRNRAVEDSYEPGSTFKLIMTAAALTAGIPPHALFPARDAIEIDGHVIHNADDGLTVTGKYETIDDIIADSLNVGAAEIGMRVGARRLYQMIRRFGFGTPTQVGLPGENPGLMQPLSQWSRISVATISFGQGISVEPLQLVMAYAAIANGGMLLRPRVIDRLVGADGQTIYRYRPEVVRRVVSEKVAAELRHYLREVVLRGTGDPSARVPGYTTAGKTGTAQIAHDGVYAPGEYNASFIGMVPAQHPRFVILVKVERPRGSIYGSEVAAPAFREIARLAMLHAGITPKVRLVRTEAKAGGKKTTR